MAQSLLILFVYSVWAAWSLPLTLATAVVAADMRGGERCPPLLCGNITISSPLGLVPEQASETNCGVLGFQVLCPNNTPYLGYYEGSYWFQILNIFYDNASLVIADVHKLQYFNSYGSKSCHSPKSNSSSKLGNSRLPASSPPPLLHAAAARELRARARLIIYNCTGAWRGNLIFYNCTGAWRGPCGDDMPQQNISIATTQTTQPEQQGCSPKECGGLDIPYSFWLEEPGRPSCGPPSFQLKCNSSGVSWKTPMFQYYRVLNIFVDNSSFHVVDDNLPLATGCPAPSFNITSGIGLGPFLISKANKVLIFLYNCTKQEAEPPGFRPMSCPKESFVRLDDEFDGHRIQREIPPGCRFSVVPTLGAPDGNGDDYVGSMKHGFLLEWTGVSGDCPECMASGGKCMYSDNGLGL
ncbi:uncharacterized protein LOC133910323 [Phragmites australis]|uniref:uncharacterized protein LOC133910323 n=1 Tax=Phragmites australis TaxID=29695 RepID=UPI002D780C40|nr:uncharacterized protein LOC133910323 [Phragmites australis]